MNNIERESMAKRLKFARQIAGLTQEEAAQKLGVCRNRLSRKENGRNKISAEEASSFAAIYQVGINWLLRGG